MYPSNDFPSYLLDKPIVGKPPRKYLLPPGARLVRRKWDYLHETFADYMQWTFDANCTILSFGLFKAKFAEAIAAMREHESDINTQIANGQNPSTAFVTNGYRRAAIPLARFISDPCRSKGRELLTGFTMRILREIVRRIELASDPNVARTRWSARQKNKGLLSR